MDKQGFDFRVLVGWTRNSFFIQIQHQDFNVVLVLELNKCDQYLDLIPFKPFET